MITLNQLKRQWVVLIVCATTAIATAQTYSTLHNFTGADGANPYSGLMQGPDGNFYGATIDGGMFGGGNVIRITPAGDVTSLYDFCSHSNCTDGQFPVSTLVLGPDGEFYGTTQNGGTFNYGSVFKVSSSGALTTLHSFNIIDGVSPYGTLLLASDGNFYGTTNEAGTCTAGGCGTVFRITPDGSFTTLHDFCLDPGCPDGEFPVGGLIEGSDGILYGTTNAGGTAVCPGGGCGTIYSITLSGAFTTLHRFNNDDGAYPAPALIEVRKGLFYGTTAGGGANRDGTVFSITAAGTLTTVHNFTGTDGFSPFVLIAGSDGELYGTTLGGGTDSAGTIFKITLNGSLTTVHSFAPHFYYYFGALTQGTDGKFYGTTYFGGPADDGTIYSVSEGLKSTVKVQPTAAKTGAAVSILGSNLSQVTSVLFNGIPATFQIVSDTQISATVPAGASTGRVEVVSQSHHVRSNIPFLVITK